MNSIKTERLVLTPFNKEDFDLFVSGMLTDPQVVEFFYSYQGLSDPNEIYNKALKDFWSYFENSKEVYGYETWAARTMESNRFIGWCGILHTELTPPYGGPELQYMLASNAFGKGYATEFASAVMHYAKSIEGLEKVIATVDIPNKGSIRVIEKLGFQFLGQIEAYGSTEMYLYEKSLTG